MTPSYKIIIPVMALYTVILFAPTMDISSFYKMEIMGLPLIFTAPSFYFPLIYPLSDSITEVYGKKISYYVVIWGYVIAVLFSLLNNFILRSSSNSQLYSFLFHSSEMLTIAGPIGYIVSSIFNIKLLSKLKLKMRGRHFIFRSMLTSQLSEIIIGLIVFPIVFYHQGVRFIFMSMSGTLLIKFIMTIPLVILARFLVSLFRYVDGTEGDNLPYNNSFAQSDKK